MNVYAVAAVWIGMALAASLISIRIGVSVALIEIVVAALLGNLPHVGQGITQLGCELPGERQQGVPVRGHGQLHGQPRGRLPRRSQPRRCLPRRCLPRGSHRPPGESGHLIFR